MYLCWCLRLNCESGTKIQNTTWRTTFLSILTEKNTDLNRIPTLLQWTYLVNPKMNTFFSQDYHCEWNSTWFIIKSWSRKILFYLTFFSLFWVFFFWSHKFSHLKNISLVSFPKKCSFYVIKIIIAVWNFIPFKNCGTGVHSRADWIIESHSTFKHPDILRNLTYIENNNGMYEWSCFRNTNFPEMNLHSKIGSVGM